MTWGLRAIAIAVLWVLLLVTPGMAQLYGDSIYVTAGNPVNVVNVLPYQFNSGDEAQLVDEEDLFGLTLNPDGSLTGTPNIAGDNVDIEVHVLNDGMVMAIGFFDLHVSRAVPVVDFTDSSAVDGGTGETAEGQDVTFTFTLTGGANPTGDVVFSMSMFGTVATVTLVDGVASYTTNTLPLGIWLIDAYYDGDGANDGASASLLHLVSVTGPPPPPDPEPDTEDSENLDLVQNRFVPLVALQSGGTIGEAIGSAANFGLAGGATAQFDGTGGFMAYAPEPAGPAAFTNILNDDSASAFGLSVWIDTRAKGLFPIGGAASRDGWQANLTAGVGARIGSDLVVGGLAGYEQFSYADTDPAGTLAGSGVSIGGYGGWRLGDDVTVDFGLVYTDLDYEVTSGAASGTFGASRLLLSGGISGSMAMGDFTVTPSARVFGLNERSEAYVDTLAYAHDARDMLTGEASAGLAVSRSLVLTDDWQLTPRVGAYVDARSDGTILVDDLVETVGGRITLGAELGNLDGAVVSIGGEVGGLGTDTLTWSAKGSVRGAF